MDLFNQTCFECSKVITNYYSTSFSLGITAFAKPYRYAIYAIYGFVRYADEIVDTFTHVNRAELIASFRADTFKAINQGISLNPVLQAFQVVVNQYGIEHKLIDAFLHSMEMDLSLTTCDRAGFSEYIYGSAEVVGLMCLHVFCQGDRATYDNLLPKARSLGAAFQKINFLRDLKSDFEDRGRTYFPGVDFTAFTEADKKRIEIEIAADFADAYQGIKLLPKGTRLGVYIAYKYYLQLFKKIQATSACAIMRKRIRVADWHKLALYSYACIEQKLNVI